MRGKLDGKQTNESRGELAGVSDKRHKQRWMVPPVADAHGSPYWFPTWMDAEKRLQDCTDFREQEKAEVETQLRDCGLHLVQ